MGRVANDPEVKVLDGIRFISIQVSTNSFYYSERTGREVRATEWHNIVCYANVAAHVNDSIKRGDTVLIDGSMRKNKYKDDNGNTHYMMQIIADKVQKAGKLAKIDERVIYFDSTGYYVCANQKEANNYEFDVLLKNRNPYDFKILMSKEKSRLIEEVIKDPFQLGF